MGRKKGTGIATKTTMPPKKQDTFKTAPFKQRIKLEKKANREQLNAVMAKYAKHNPINEEEIYVMRDGTLLPIREQMIGQIRESVKIKMQEQSTKDAQAVMLCRTEFKSAMDMSARVDQVQQTFIRSLTDQVTMYKSAYATLLNGLSKDVVARIRPELEGDVTVAPQVGMQQVAVQASIESPKQHEPNNENLGVQYQLEIASRNNQIESLTAELQNAQRNCVILTEQLGAVKQENSMLMTTSGNAQEVLGRQNRDLIQQNNVLINQNNDLVNKNEALQVQLNHFGDVNQALTEVVRERDIARKTAAEHANEIEKLTVEWNVARAQINQLRLEKGHLNARNTYYELTFGAKKCNIEGDPLAISIKETEHLNNQLRMAQETLKQRDAQMKEMMAYLDQIKQASSALPIGK